ncbi:MAG: hypothetical protein B7C24_05165 [Bacteroidetes bacterium 4572_77]|nr:MAG: hypothetical protein B7C24_05165 [Bacteroidetes bacterium 4572_77]
MSDFWYECVDCGQTWDNSRIRYLCPSCEKQNSADKPPKGVLWVRYAWPKNPESKTAQDLLHHLWPIKDKRNFPLLSVGQTPLYAVQYQEKNKESMELFLKDDSQNPSYSFKDRASYLVSAFAKEHNIKILVTASTGNAGSSLAAICAANHQKAIILLPESAPEAKLLQVQMYGAQLIKVQGNYDKAFEDSIQLSKKNNWFNRNTAYNPFTIEGKKSVSYEIFEQTKAHIPDYIFVPVGDGVIISALYKGFEELLHMELIPKMPTALVLLTGSGLKDLKAPLAFMKEMDSLDL